VIQRREIKLNFQKSNASYILSHLSNNLVKFVETNNQLNNKSFV